MLVKVRDITGRQVVDVEADEKGSFASIGDAARAAFGYHGNYTIRLPSGEKAPRGQNLEDNEEFMGIDLSPEPDDEGNDTTPIFDVVDAGA